MERVTDTTKRKRGTEALPSSRPWGIDPHAFAGVFHRLEDRLFSFDPRVLARAAWNFSREAAAAAETAAVA